MTILAWYFVLLSFLVFSMSLYLLAKNPSRTYFYLWLLSLSVIVWLLPFGLFPLYSGDGLTQTWLLRVSTLAGSWHPALLFFVINAIVTHGRKYSRPAVAFLLVSSAAVSILDLTPGVILAASVSKDQVSLSLGPWALPLTVFFIALYLFYPTRFLLRNYHHTHGKARVQMKYIALCLVIAVLVEQTTNTVLPVLFGNTNWYPLGCSVCFFAVLLVYYGFHEEKLYDLDLVLGHVFKTPKYHFHRHLHDFIHRLPVLLSHEKIVVELSRFLGAVAGIELFDQGIALYARNGVVIPQTPLANRLKQHLGDGILRTSLSLKSLALKHGGRRELQKNGLAFAVPLISEGRLWGFLSLGNECGNKLYSRQDFDQLAHLAQQLVVACKIIAIKDLMVHEKDSEIHRLSEAVAQLQPAEVDAHLARALSRIPGRDQEFPLLGHDAALKKIIAQASLVAQYSTPILITGETGTGKENLARLAHHLSGRQPFLAVNCAAIPQNLLESEMFGYTKGAFTGAACNKAGFFLKADGGTLFLDEIAELSLTLQSKLLRVLQDGMVQPLGSTSAHYVNVRLIAATHRALDRKIKLGEFREDLYHRIHVIHFEMPALRDRQDDIVLLAHFFLKKFNDKYDKSCQFSQGFLSQLKRQAWPGNVRQLQNEINRLVVLAGPQELLASLETPAKPDGSAVTPVPTPAFAEDLALGMKEIVERTKKEIILRALNCTKSHKEAADLLKIAPSNLSMYLKKLKLPAQASPLH